MIIKVRGGAVTGLRLPVTNSSDKAGRRFGCRQWQPEPDKEKERSFRGRMIHNRYLANDGDD